MRSLSLWGDGKLSSRTTPQNKTKAFTLAPQVPTGRTPTFLSPPTKYLWPSRRPLPGNLCQVSHKPLPENQLSLQAWGVRVVWWKFAGKEEGILPEARGRGLSCLGSHSPLLTSAPLTPQQQLPPRKSWNVWVSLGVRKGPGKGP